MSNLPKTIDLLHLGNAKAMAAHLHDGWIIDPGPESTVETLLEGLEGETPKGILLTHIHFDHAGATGALVKRFPDLPVWVHENGAKHMIDPTRLVASARGVFGEAFDYLWGEVMPIPAENVKVLKGGEDEAGWQVKYTPGHASHHVCFLHKETGVAFVGDVAGIRIDGGPAMPPTPPPDINPELWHQSLDAVAQWQPKALALMHFGVYEDVADQLATMHESLDLYANTSRDFDADQMQAKVTEWVRGRNNPGGEATLRAMGPFPIMHKGLARYWQKRQEAAAESALT